MHGELAKLGLSKSLCHGYFLLGFEFGRRNVCVILPSYLHVVESPAEGDGDLSGSQATCEEKYYQVVGFGDFCSYSLSPAELHDLFTSILRTRGQLWLQYIQHHGAFNFTELRNASVHAVLEYAGLQETLICVVLL